MRLLVLLFSVVLCSGAFQTSFSEPLSIVFIIDNSGSMNGENGNPTANDQWGTRYSVVSDLLDSVLKAEPASEIGLVIFREYLYLDTTSQEYYAQYFHSLSEVYDSNPDQAYLPFIQLNATYSGSVPGSQQINRRGIEIIKDILQTDTIKSSRNEYIGLKYSPNFTTTGSTNINIALIAAKEILLNANNPKDRQFIVFLSDGEPQGNVQAGLPLNWFQSQDGTQYLPATFTLFFTQNKVPPASLQTMTHNICINGYSTSNPLSNLWAINADYNAMMALLTQNVLGKIISVRPNMHNYYSGSAEDLTHVRFYDILGRQLTLHSRQASGNGADKGIIRMSNCSGIYISKSHRYMILER